MLVPLYGFLRGDTIGLVVLVHDHQSIAEVAATLQEAAAVRVEPRPHADVFVDGRRLDPRQTVHSAGLRPLTRIDVVPRDA